LQVFEADDVSVQSKDTVEEKSQMQANSFVEYMSKKTSTYFSDSLLPGLQLDDLYNHFEVSLTGFKVRFCAYSVSLFPPSHPHEPVRSICIYNIYIYACSQVKVSMAGRHAKISTLVKLDASIVFGLCIFLDEPMLKQLEVLFLKNRQLLLWF
jgi:hypothetical protein